MGPEVCRVWVVCQVWVVCRVCQVWVVCLVWVVCRVCQVWVVCRVWVVCQVCLVEAVVKWSDLASTISMPKKTVMTRSFPTWNKYKTPTKCINCHVRAKTVKMLLFHYVNYLLAENKGFVLQ